MKTWNTGDAQSCFAELMRRALTGEPQRISGEGRGAVVVIDEPEYERLRGRKLERAVATPAAGNEEGLVDFREYVLKQPPVDADDDDFDFSEFLERIREEDRHCVCCTRRTERGRAADAERGLQVLDRPVRVSDE